LAQTSGPISSGTLAERQFTDVMWRDLFGDEPGVVGDMDGTAYRLTLPTNSDTVQVGSATQASLARVAGFSHRIPAGETEGLTIPVTASTRTDAIVLRYDPANTGAPGPVRLHRIGGSGSAIPPYDASPPGVEDLPLWAITRTAGQALSQATTRRLFPRLAPVLELPAGTALPSSSPIGTIANQGATTFVRDLDAQGVAVWTQRDLATSSTPAIHGGWSGNRRVSVQGKSVTVSLNLTRSGPTFTMGAWDDIATLLTGLPDPAIGTHAVGIPSQNQDEFGAWQLTIASDGDLWLRSRWRARTFASGGFVAMSFSYVAA
jgi:hypothetical protein